MVNLAVHATAAQEDDSELHQPVVWLTGDICEFTDDYLVLICWISCMLRWQTFWPDLICPHFRWVKWNLIICVIICWLSIDFRDQKSQYKQAIHSTIRTTEKMLTSGLILIHIFSWPNFNNALYNNTSECLSTPPLGHVHGHPLRSAVSGSGLFRKRIFQRPTNRTGLGIFYPGVRSTQGEPFFAL